MTTRVPTPVRIRVTTTPARIRATAVAVTRPPACRRIAASTSAARNTPRRGRSSPGPADAGPAICLRRRTRVRPAVHPTTAGGLHARQAYPQARRPVGGQLRHHHASEGEGHRVRRAVHLLHPVHVPR